MATQIFVNLPVKDLEKSKAFFGALGFSFNPQFTDDNGACMIIEDGASYAMLLSHTRFKEFTPKPIADSATTTGALIALSRDSRADVEEIVKKAVAAGGSTYAEPADHGFMYQHGFMDPDGHIWEVLWMDPAALQQDAA